MMTVVLRLLLSAIPDGRRSFLERFSRQGYCRLFHVFHASAHPALSIERCPHAAIPEDRWSVRSPLLCQRTRWLAHWVSRKDDSRYRQHGRYAIIKVCPSIIPQLLTLDTTGWNGTAASICGTACFTFALVRSTHLHELRILHRTDLSIVLPNSELCRARTQTDILNVMSTYSSTASVRYPVLPCFPKFTNKAFYHH